MSIFKKLFGGGANAEETDPSESYQGFTITPILMKESDGYRISARIEKEIAGELKSHHMIRADTVGGAAAANDASMEKAKQVIDQLGDRLFQYHTG